MRRRTAAVAALLCGVSAVAAVPAVHAGPSHAAGWVITRTGRGPALLTGKFTGSADSATATAVLFALSGRGKSRKLAGAFTTGRIDWGADGSPRVYTVPTSCLAACTDPVDTPAELTFSSNGHKLDAAVYIATWDVKNVTIDITSPGWRKRPWMPSMRTVQSENAGDVGVRALHTSAGRFTGAEAPGGKYGSVGWGVLPCDTYGSGNGLFTGGPHKWPIHCEYDRSAFDFTAGATRWRLSGDATGVGAIVNVLVVVDYPAG
jgi:hypothetical protein